MLLKSAKKDNIDPGDDIFKSEPSIARPKMHANHFTTTATTTTTISTSVPQHILTPSSKVFNDYDWDVVDEYDPLWPNEYEKLVKDRRDKDGGGVNTETSGTGGKHHRDKHGGGGYHGGGGNDGRQSYKRRGGANNRFDHDLSTVGVTKPQFSGFGGRPDDEDTYTRSPPNSSGAARSGGAAIAPPPSLQESTAIIPAFAGAAGAAAAGSSASSVAAKIMAKYGFRDGQGLGKQEQGMSAALQVEKTSKRGGRIIHERESAAASSPGRTQSSDDGGSSPPPTAATSVMAMPAQQQLMLPPSMVPGAAVNKAASSATVATKSNTESVVAATVPAEEPTITEIMKAPSKVVLLRNMVGPGDVDNDLEPEVKDECNTKYGEVVSVVINELQNVVAEEAVRIFVEFKRIESAIKAVVDLNGRFFGGRQVKAGFFGFDKYKAYQLYD